MVFPPGPRAPAAVQTAQWVLRPDRFLETCAERHGDPFTIRVLWGDGPMVLTRDSEAIAQVFKDASQPDGPLRGGAGARLLVPFAGPTSILVSAGEDHVRRRKLLLPAFHGDALQAMQPEIARIAREHVARWPAGRPFDAHERARALTLDVILRVLFGARDPGVLEPLRTAVIDALAITHSAPALLAMSVLPRDFGPRSPYGRFARAVARVDARLAEAVGATPDDGTPSALDALRREQVTGPELRDHLVTLLAAGHETTATALAWALECLARHPEVVAWATTRERVGAVADETLRLKPALSIAPRTTTRAYTLKGHELPPGTQVAACLLLAMRDPATWGPDAGTFNPSRWLEGEPGTFIPWGGGTRRCAGAPFARLELVEAITAVLERGTLGAERPEPERARRRSVTLAPARGARVMLHPR